MTSDENATDDDISSTHVEAGATVPHDDVDLAAATLARMKRASSTTPTSPRGTKSRAKSTRSTDERDPQLLGDAVSRLIDERGWSSDAAGGDLVANWAVVVGPELADHVAIERIDGTLLVLKAESTTWKNAATLFIPTMQTAIDEAIGAGVITEIRVNGPAAPSWVKGPRTVKGRGPRDTYG